MRATDRSLDVIAFLSEHLRDIVRRRLSELAGLALITLALLGAIALATWSVQDPSLSHATQKPIHNLLGYPGAIFSDLAMQLLGLSAVLLLVPEALLGWRLIGASSGRRKVAKPDVDRRDLAGRSFCIHVAAHRFLAIADRTWRRRGRRGPAHACDDFWFAAGGRDAAYPLHSVRPFHGRGGAGRRPWRTARRKTRRPQGRGRRRN